MKQPEVHIAKAGDSANIYTIEAVKDISLADLKTTNDQSVEDIKRIKALIDNMSKDL